MSRNPKKQNSNNLNEPHVADSTYKIHKDLTALAMFNEINHDKLSKQEKETINNIWEYINPPQNKACYPHILANEVVYCHKGKASKKSNATETRTFFLIKNGWVILLCSNVPKNSGHNLQTYRGFIAKPWDRIKNVIDNKTANQPRKQEKSEQKEVLIKLSTKPIKQTAHSKIAESLQNILSTQHLDLNKISALVDILKNQPKKFLFLKRQQKIYLQYKISDENVDEFLIQTNKAVLNNFFKLFLDKIDDYRKKMDIKAMQAITSFVAAGIIFLSDENINQLKKYLPYLDGPQLTQFCYLFCDRNDKNVTDLLNCLITAKVKISKIDTPISSLIFNKLLNGVALKVLCKKEWWPTVFNLLERSELAEKETFLEKLIRDAAKKENRIEANVNSMRNNIIAACRIMPDTFSSKIKRIYKKYNIKIKKEKNSSKNNQEKIVMPFIDLWQEAVKQKYKRDRKRNILSQYKKWMEEDLNVSYRKEINQQLDQILKSFPDNIRKKIKENRVQLLEEALKKSLKEALVNLICHSGKFLRDSIASSFKNFSGKQESRDSQDAPDVFKKICFHIMELTNLDQAGPLSAYLKKTTAFKKSYPAIAQCFSAEPQLLGFPMVHCIVMGKLKHLEAFLSWGCCLNTPLDKFFENPSHLFDYLLAQCLAKPKVTEKDISIICKNFFPFIERNERHRITNVNLSNQKNAPWMKQTFLAAYVIRYLNALFNNKSNKAIKLFWIIKHLLKNGASPKAYLTNQNKVEIPYNLMDMLNVFDSSDKKIEKSLFALKTLLKRYGGVSSETKFPICFLPGSLSFYQTSNLISGNGGISKTCNVTQNVIPQRKKAIITIVCKIFNSLNKNTENCEKELSKQLDRFTADPSIDGYRLDLSGIMHLLLGKAYLHDKLKKADKSCLVNKRDHFLFNYLNFLNKLITNYDSFDVNNEFFEFGSLFGFACILKVDAVINKIFDTNLTLKFSEETKRRAIYEITTWRITCSEQEKQNHYLELPASNDAAFENSKFIIERRNNALKYASHEAILNLDKKLFETDNLFMQLTQLSPYNHFSKESYDQAINCYVDKQLKKINQQLQKIINTNESNSLGTSRQQLLKRREKFLRIKSQMDQILKYMPRPNFKGLEENGVHLIRCENNPKKALNNNQKKALKNLKKCYIIKSIDKYYLAFYSSHEQQVLIKKIPDDSDIEKYIEKNPRLFLLKGMISDYTLLKLVKKKIEKLGGKINFDTEQNNKKQKQENNQNQRKLKGW